MMNDKRKRRTRSNGGMISVTKNMSDDGKWGCEKATTRMGKMIEQSWIRKTSEVSGALSSIERFGPDPQITIPASGFRKCRIQRPYRRPHSITCTLDQKLLAPRAATTEDTSISVRQDGKCVGPGTCASELIHAPEITLNCTMYMLT